MKKLFIISTFIIHCSLFIIHCSAQQEFDYLDINNVKAYINPLNLFSKEGNASFEIPKGSGKHTIYNANIWLGGLDKQDNLHVAAQLYGEKGEDYFMGPITNDYTMVDGKKVVSEAYKEKYFRTWKVKKEEIEYHKLHYADAGYQMPSGIANWPAHGRTQFGESSSLASYIKVSGSVNYNPSQGDYPNILGDEAVLFIINDALNEHTESGGEPVGVEILGMAYAYNQTDNYYPAPKNTIYLQYVIKNRSTHNYKDFYVGFFSDFDLGYKYDDFIGCDSVRHLAFVYNGKEIDGAGESGAYGANPPAQGAMFLNHKMNAFMNIMNIFQLPNPHINEPEIASDYYNYMRAIWKDGTHLTYYGTGYNPNSTDNTNFMFNSRFLGTMGTWTEIGNNNPPGDRRGVMSSGPFTLPVAGRLTIDIALPYGRAEQGGVQASLSELLMASDSAHLFHSNISFIGGKAEYQDQSPFSLGDVLLYSMENSGQYVLCNKVRLGDSNNIFTPKEIFGFGGVKDGNYIVKIIPDSTENVLPTYYGNTENWSEATIVSIVNQVGKNTGAITMIPMEPLDGSSIISGYVGEDSGGKKSILSSKTSNPVPDVSVYLQSYKENKWTTITYALTNEDGYFVFQNVPIGSYRVILDIPGLEITNPPIVEITEDGQIVDDLFFEIDLGITDVLNKLENKVIIYPNPSNGQFTIKSEKVIKSFELYDAMGKKVYSDSPKTESTQISTKLPSGLYFYRAVLQDHSISSGKVVVQ